MTATLTKAPVTTGVWNTMPGWGIVGDLTPPEIIAVRRLRILRRIIAVVLGVILVGCVLGFAYATHQKSVAQDQADSATSQTAMLQAKQSKYNATTRMQSAVDTIRAEVAATLATDVDTAKFLGLIRQALPPSMAIQNLSVTINANGATTPAGGLDNSGAQQIGTVTVSGSAQAISDLATLVDHLAALPGVVNVVPTSNQASGRAVQYSVTFGITSALYSHHYTATHGAK